MKKKIVALLLVLVLSVAMMVPVFAAAVEPRACSHNWIILDRVITGYSTINGTLHYVNWTQDRICSLCANREFYISGKYQESHWPPCSKCGCGLG